VANLESEEKFSKIFIDLHLNNIVTIENDQKILAYIESKLNWV